MTSSPTHVEPPAPISGDLNAPKNVVAQLEQVTKYRGDKLVLNQIDLTVHEGEMLGSVDFSP